MLSQPAFFRFPLTRLDAKDTASRNLQQADFKASYRHVRRCLSGVSSAKYKLAAFLFRKLVP